ncbi:MAG: hypothetical protein WD002_11495 [Pseudomonadales bacterium]
MIERVIVFLILGFFVFDPGIQSFWSRGPLGWYANYLVWLALIGACYFSGRRASKDAGD